MRATAGKTIKRPGIDDGVYYQHAGRIALIRQISLRARLAVLGLLLDELNPNSDTSIVDLGVSLDVRNTEANVLEQFYPYPGRIIAAGIGDGTDVQRAYPLLRFVRIEPRSSLPFSDKEFDIGYSNAVVEHAGSREDQRDFISELCRVSKRFFVVVPNRLFPIEQHTALPFLHYLPLPLFRGLIRRSPFTYWAEEANLNPLYPAQFRSLFPSNRKLRLLYTGIGVSIWKSNIVAIG
jgi:Methyltransferase domain